MTNIGTAAITQRTNTNFGTVTTAASNLPGIIFTPVKAQQYHVCAYPKVSADTLNHNIAFKLWDGTTVIAEGGKRGVANLHDTMPLCGFYNATSTASVALEIQCKDADGGGCQISTAGTAISSIEWEIFANSQSVPAPLLVGSVTSNSSGIERIERANITAAGAITSQSGSWLSSASLGATGVVTLTIATGMFSIAPACTVTNNSGGTQVTTAFTTLTTTSIVTKIMNASSAANADFSIICMGPR
jgi:hypothetical protein